MACERVRSRLGAYADGELGDDLRREFAEHLADCAGCAEELASLRALGALLGRLPTPPAPLGLESAILGAALRSDMRVRRSSRLWSSVLGVAAALLVALVGAYLGLRSSKLPSAPVEIARAPAGDPVERLYEQSLALLPADSPGAEVLSLYEEGGR
jgi:anti-sigma factor RsiW